MYDHGWGVPVDATQSVAWLKRGAEQKNPLDLYELGRLYEQGISVPQDYGHALKLYQLASNGLFQPALLALSKMYRDGHGVKPSQQTAYMWAWLAGHRGNAEGKQLAKALEAQLNNQQIDIAKKEAVGHSTGRILYTDNP